MQNTGTAYEFEQFRLDLDLFELRRQGEIIPLQRRQMDVLIYLLENRSRLVSRDELLDTVWADAKVSDAALATAIRGVRRALGDSGRHQHMISTRKRYGFRFVAAVRMDTGEGELEHFEPVHLVPAPQQYA